uniref:Male-enhanced antigen 1 n=1 Tax=Suricata suricatta TaxID=37032 RepID=A0A673T2T8_SURSU
MAAVVLGGDTMGPERIFPNQTEELGPHQGPMEGTGDWSSEEPEEEQEETGVGPAGYSYQPLNQDPEQEVELAPMGDGEDVVADIQDRIQALGLHLPDPPLESEDEEEEGATGLSNHSSIPMDPEHVELVKRTMAGVSLPAPGVPAWAREISDAQWEDVARTSRGLNASLAIMSISIFLISLSTSRQIRLLRDPLYSVLYIWGHWPKPNPS